MPKTKRFIMLVAVTMLCVNAMMAGGFVIRKNQTVIMEIGDAEADVVKTSISLLQKDLKAVFASETRIRQAGSIVVATKPEVVKGEQAFELTVKDGKLYITGSDALGTAYGVMQLSRNVGVSPWEWWADSPIRQRDSYELPEGYTFRDKPAVLFRGIFINDEDGGFTPWAYRTYEPSETKGSIGPKTHEKVFELLLRLRANVFWPAMHGCTVPFFLIEGNRETAAKYGITLGTSHCEPMMCNANGEWDVRGTGGEYNYISNKGGVTRFWEERVSSLSSQNACYTLGMRGKHDTSMLGVKTSEEQKNALERVMADQREMLAKYINKDVTKIPQVFVPYKEVLDIYNSGLKVPDDVTLLWCDDNYGYMTHLPTKAERKRQGGHGLYYHLSYCGRPQNYLMLAGNSPALVRTELERAYDNGVQRMWIFNVGDIKPAEFQMEYCLDMAWSETLLHEKDYTKYMTGWFEREFPSKGKQLSELFTTFYDLCYERRPEHMGNTRNEEKDKNGRAVRDLPWLDSRVRKRIDRVSKLWNDVCRMEVDVPATEYPHWYELVGFQIRAMKDLNIKHLQAQLARHGKGTWQSAVAAHHDLMASVKDYNKMLDGKWNHINDILLWQREFNPVDTTQKLSAPVEIADRQVMLTAKDFNNVKPSAIIPHLGYSGNAIAMQKGETVEFSLPALPDESAELSLCFVPNRALLSTRLTVEVTVEGERPQSFNYETYGRSEQWKQSVLCNQAIRTLTVPPSKHQRKVTIKALTPCVVFDYVHLRYN